MKQSVLVLSWILGGTIWCMAAVGATEPAQKSSSTVNDKLQEIVKSARAMQQAKQGGGAPKLDSVSTASEVSTDSLIISHDDFGHKSAPARIRVRITPEPQEQAANVPQQDPDSLEDGPKLVDKTKKASLRNVGYKYAADGRRVYDDGSITNQTGDRIDAAGNKLRYE